METDKSLIVDQHGNEMEHYEPTQIIQMSESHLQNYEFMADNMERFIKAKEKIWQAVLKIVKVWTVFGDTADIGWAEADRIAMTFGVSFVNWTSHKAESKDEKGDKYIWSYECDSIFQGRSVHVQGNFSSRDKLLGKTKEGFRPLYEINEQHIQMASMRNCRKEGVKVLFGISRIPVEELIKAGVCLEYAEKVEFKKKDEVVQQATPESKAMRAEISNMLMELAGKDLEKAKTLLETFTTWTNKENQIVKGKRSTAELSEAQIPHVYKKIKDAYDKRGIDETKK